MKWQTKQSRDKLSVWSSNNVKYKIIISLNIALCSLSFSLVLLLKENHSYPLQVNLMGLNYHCGILSMGPVKEKLGGRWWAIAAKKGDIKGAPPGNIPNVGGRRGRADNLNFSSSASWSRFALARRFWNQIFTCNKATLVVKWITRAKTREEAVLYKVYI